MTARLPFEVVILRPCRRCGTLAKPPKTPGDHPTMSSRRLCGPCYGELYRTGGLAAYPRLIRCRDDVLEIWRRSHRARVRAGDCTLAEAASDMGMTRSALAQTLSRARRAGLEVAA